VLRSEFNDIQSSNKQTKQQKQKNVSGIRLLTASDDVWPNNNLHLLQMQSNCAIIQYQHSPHRARKTAATQGSTIYRKVKHGWNAATLWRTVVN